MSDPLQNPKNRPDPFQGYKPLQAVFERNPFALLGPPLEAAGNFTGDVIVEVLTGEPRHAGEPSKFPPAVKKVAEDAAVLAVPGPGVKVGLITFEGDVPFTHRRGNRQGLGSGEEQKLAQEQAVLKAKLAESRERLLAARAVPSTPQLGPDGLPLRFALFDAPRLIAGGVVAAGGVEVAPGVVRLLTSDQRGRVFFSDTTVVLPTPTPRPFFHATDTALGGSPDAAALAPIPSGSIDPTAIEPVNDAAKRNQDGATGINKELVHERADP